MAIGAATAVVLISRYEAGQENILYTPGFVILIAGRGRAVRLWNGLLVAFFDIQPIIATLILMISGRGIAQMITEGQSPTFTNRRWRLSDAARSSGCRFRFTSRPRLIIVTLFVRRTAIG